MNFEYYEDKLDKVDFYFSEDALFVILKLLYAPPKIPSFKDYRYGLSGNPSKVLKAFIWLYIHYNADISTFIDVYRSKVDGRLSSFELPDSNRFNVRLESGRKFFRLCYPSSIIVGPVPASENHLVRTGDHIIKWGQQFKTPKLPRSGSVTLQKNLEQYLTKFRTDTLQSESIGVIYINYNKTIEVLCKYLLSLLAEYKKSEVVFHSQNFLKATFGNQIDLLRPTIRLLEMLLDLMNLKIIGIKDIQNETFVSRFNTQLGFRSVLVFPENSQEKLNIAYVKNCWQVNELHIKFDIDKRALQVGEKEVFFAERETRSPFPVIELVALIGKHYPNKIHRDNAYNLFQGKFTKSKSYVILKNTIKRLNKRLKGTKLRIKQEKPFITFAILP